MSAVFGSESSSKTSSTQQGVSDAGIGIITGKKSTTLFDSFLNSGKLNIGGVDASASWGGKVNVAVNDLAQVQGLVDKIAAAEADGLGRLSETLSSGQKMALDKLSELAKSQQTGGETERDKSVLYVVGIFAVGIVLVLVLGLFRRRSNG